MDIVKTIYHKLKKDKSFDYYRDYSLLQWQSQQEIAGFQFAKIKELLEHAYNTSAYYKRLLETRGITPKDIRSFSDFAELPVLTKELIKNNTPDLISSEYTADRLIRNTSGGSTGEPLTFYQDRILYEQMEANGLLGFSFAGWSGKEPFYYFWGNPREFRRKKTFATKLKEKLSGRIIFNSYNYNEEIIAEWVEAIRLGHGVFLYGYTSVLADIARYVQRNGIAIKSVKGVLTTAEKLYLWQRELLENSFGARVYDQYGSREVPGIACECGEGNMHLLSHSAYIEFVDDPAVIGNSKKIIATCLTNFAMPFIRYEIGDYARPKEGTCPCGRGFPMMEMDIGRTADCFVTPEGNVIYGTFFVRQMYGHDHVRSFQFHQTTPDTVNLYIVRGNNFSDDDGLRLEEIKQTIRDHASATMRLVIQFVDEIPKTRGGKHRFVVSDVAR